MTAHDESPEGFLERWSRRKIDGEQQPPDAPQTSVAAAPEPAGPAAENAAVTPATAVAKPEFDLSSLPSLESITAGTDIRAFLNPGVPADIARAALRRAWAADPTIRDFVGLAENAWDFNDPTAMPGFGPLEPGYDIKKVVAQIFGEVEKLPADTPAPEQVLTAQPSHLTEKKASPEPPADAQQTARADVESGAPTRLAAEQETHSGDLVQCDNIIASHKSNFQTAADERKTRRIMAVHCLSRKSCP